MSPIGLKEGTRIIVDQTVMEMYNACAGANEKDFHYVNVNPKRDFKDVTVADIRMVIDSLAEITGEERITPQETLNSIFSSYCIGK